MFEVILLGKIWGGHDFVNECVRLGRHEWIHIAERNGWKLGWYFKNVLGLDYSLPTQIVGHGHVDHVGHPSSRYQKANEPKNFHAAIFSFNHVNNAMACRVHSCSDDYIFDLFSWENIVFRRAQKLFLYHVNNKDQKV